MSYIGGPLPKVDEEDKEPINPVEGFKTWASSVGRVNNKLNPTAGEGGLFESESDYIDQGISNITTSISNQFNKLDPKHQELLLDSAELIKGAYKYTKENPIDTYILPSAAIHTVESLGKFWQMGHGFRSFLLQGVGIDKGAADKIALGRQLFTGRAFPKVPKRFPGVSTTISKLDPALPSTTKSLSPTKKLRNVTPGKGEQLLNAFNQEFPVNSNVSGGHGVSFNQALTTTPIKGLIPDLTTGGLGPLMTPYPSSADVKLTQWGSTGGDKPAPGSPDQGQNDKRKIQKLKRIYGEAVDAIEIGKPNPTAIPTNPVVEKFLNQISSSSTLKQYKQIKGRQLKAGLKPNPQSDNLIDVDGVAPVVNYPLGSEFVENIKSGNLLNTLNQLDNETIFAISKQFREVPGSRMAIQDLLGKASSGNAKAASKLQLLATGFRNKFDIQAQELTQGHRREFDYDSLPGFLGTKERIVASPEIQQALATQKAEIQKAQEGYAELNRRFEAGELTKKRLAEKQSELGRLISDLGATAPEEITGPLLKKQGVNPVLAKKGYQKKVTKANTLEGALTSLGFAPTNINILGERIGKLSADPNELGIAAPIQGVQQHHGTLPNFEGSKLMEQRAIRENDAFKVYIWERLATQYLTVMGAAAGNMWNLPVSIHLKNLHKGFLDKLGWETYWRDKLAANPNMTPHEIVGALDIFMNRITFPTIIKAQQLLDAPTFKNWKQGDIHIPKDLLKLADKRLNEIKNDPGIDFTRGGEFPVGSRRYEELAEEWFRKTDNPSSLGVWDSPGSPLSLDDFKKNYTNNPTDL